MSSARFVAEKVLRAAHAAKAEALQASGDEAVQRREAIDRLISLATAADGEYGDRFVTLSKDDLLLIYQQMMTK